MSARLLWSSSWPRSRPVPAGPVNLWGNEERGRTERRAAPPARPLIHQYRNNGIENNLPVLRDEFQAAQNRQAADGVMNQLPPRLRKKMFALRLRIEWMVNTYGREHVGLQTMTIRENVTDPKEFQRRFKSIATNAFPKIYLDWLRVYERQKRGAWHAHVVVVTKEDIRTGTDVVALNQLLKDHRDRRISKAVYYAGIKRLASENLRGIWKEFRRLCGLKEFKLRRKIKGARYYKFDACHLLPLISSAEALAVYVSKYISKGFEYRRLEDKGIRLVGCTRKVSKVCNERFSWADGGGKLWRGKLGILAGLLNVPSLDEFAKRFGSKWAYHLQPAVEMIILPYYEDMRLARMDGWNLVNERGERWPHPDLRPSPDAVRQSHGHAFTFAQDIRMKRDPKRRNQDCPGALRRKSVPRFFVESAERKTPTRHPFASWIAHTVKDD